MFNIIFPSTGLLTSVGDQEALVNKVDAACNRNREKEDQSEESDERLRNEKSSGQWRLQSCPVKTLLFKIEKGKEWKSGSGWVCWKMWCNFWQTEAVVITWKLRVSRLGQMTQNTAKTKVFRNQVGVLGFFCRQLIRVWKSCYLQLQWGIRCDPISIVGFICC